MVDLVNQLKGYFSQHYSDQQINKEYFVMCLPSYVANPVNWDFGASDLFPEQNSVDNMHITISYYGLNNITEDLIKEIAENLGIKYAMNEYYISFYYSYTVDNDSWEIKKDEPELVKRLKLRKIAIYLDKVNNLELQIAKIERDLFCERNTWQFGPYMVNKDLTVNEQMVYKTFDVDVLPEEYIKKIASNFNLDYAYALRADKVVFYCQVE